MDERVLGDMPSEGSEGSRRFGIYSAHSPGPKMHSISRIRFMFVVAIAIVVAFAVIFPMVQYASRSRKNTLPYPEIANTSLLDEISRTNTHNCSTKVLSFGLDCTESPPVIIESETVGPQGEEVPYDGKSLEGHSNGIGYQEDSTEIEMDVAESRGTKYDRMGRSRWPVVSTPYPFYSLPKPTPVASADDRKGVDLPEQTNIFAIPADMSTDKFSDYPKPRINFTPSPYAFTPFPNFTDSYAQLSPYKVPKNYTNFEEILKFLNNKEDMKINQPIENSERIMTGRTPMMKVSGTYMMPLDRRRPGEIIVSSSESYNEARPFFNGHAYVTDPFLKFRPANPSEINRLIPVKSSVDIGPRFRKPVSFVPSSSVPVDLYAPVPPPNDYSTAGSHTVAIFHPPPSLINHQRPTTPPSKDKPLSVTLDIYPVTVEAEPEDVSPSTPGRVRGRLDPRWRPKTTERPRWRPQVPRRPSSLGGTKSSDNHMIVHLNLFPNKRKQYTFPRRGRQESTTQSDQKTTFLPGGQFSSRSDQVLESSKEDANTEVENRGTTDSTSSTSGGANDYPEYSALSSFGIEEVHTTTPGVNYDHDMQRDTGEDSSNKTDNGQYSITSDKEDEEAVGNGHSGDEELVGVSSPKDKEEEKDAARGHSADDDVFDGEYSPEDEEEKKEAARDHAADEEVFDGESSPESKGEKKETDEREVLEDGYAGSVTLAVTESVSGTIEKVEENSA